MISAVIKGYCHFENRAVPFQNEAWPYGIWRKNTRNQESKSKQGRERWKKIQKENERQKDRDRQSDTNEMLLPLFCYMPFLQTSLQPESLCCTIVKENKKSTKEKKMWCEKGKSSPTSDYVQFEAALPWNMSWDIPVSVNVLCFRGCYSCSF